MEHRIHFNCTNSCSLILPWYDLCERQTTYSLDVSSVDATTIHAAINSNTKSCSVPSSSPCISNQPLSIGSSSHISLHLQSNTTFSTQFSFLCINKSTGIISPTTTTSPKFLRTNGSHIEMSIPLFVALLVISACICGFFGFIFLHCVRCSKSNRNRDVTSTSSNSSWKHDSNEDRGEKESFFAKQRGKRGSAILREETPEEQDELDLDPKIVNRVSSNMNDEHRYHSQNPQGSQSASPVDTIVTRTSFDGIGITSAADTESIRQRRSTTAFTAASDDTFVVHPERDTMGSFPMNQLQSVLEDYDSEGEIDFRVENRKTVTV